MHCQPEQGDRVGGDVKAPQRIDTPDPRPPKNFREGVVVISCVLGPNGRVHNPKVTTSLSSEADASALAAVERWKFKPATKDDLPVAVQISIMVSFRKPSG